MIDSVCIPPGGHIHPGVTVAFATVGKLPWRKVPHYVLGQHLGGFFAAAVLYFTYYGKTSRFNSIVRLSKNSQDAHKRMVLRKSYNLRNIKECIFRAKTLRKVLNFMLCSQ